ncbi:regulatory TetR family protein [Motilibacter peucedani]|uniref:Regulatory TetR family protein n=1 Tax=Motilibacter peucedani TaxID=598650 RepID=A0A420XNE0_9ACTN|nr:helix-turn-helix domain-containing protein [Motilibacter peucedani]RKS72797.1 regulatory TetR family protein [Motilibacter peucedani]
MGRPRGFDEVHVVAAAAQLFVERGYEGTSVDDLVTSLGVHRGSLYRAFGSKRGLFVTALRGHVARLDEPDARTTGASLDLLLVAALELAPRDDEVRALLERACTRLASASGTGDPAAVLGARLLARAGLPLPTDRTEHQR